MSGKLGRTLCPRHNRYVRSGDFYRPCPECGYEVPMYERDAEPKPLEYCDIHTDINDTCECR